MTWWYCLTLLLGLFAYLAAWSRVPSKARGLTVLCFLISAPLSGAILIVNAGWAVPLVPYLTDLPEGETTVEGVRLEPEVAIYVMLDANGSPRLYRLPWDAQTASKLQRMMERGEGQIMARKKGRSEDNDVPLEFHERPQPSYPDKQPEARGLDLQGAS